MFIGSDKKKRLNKLLVLTEKKFGRGPSGKWRNKDFEDLCFTIHVETKILISPGTLKRVFGKTKTTEGYFPQEATITALENYTGFDLFPAIPVKKQKIHLFKTSYILVLLSFFLLITIVFFLLKPDSEALPTGTVELQKIDGKSPATVYYNYQFTETGDSVFFNFGDTDEIQILKRNQGNISHYYRHPGKFSAYLQTRETRISEKTDFCVSTNGWQALAYYFKQPYQDRYFPVPLKKNCENGIFQLSGKYLSSLGMDTTRIVVVRIDNYQQTKSTGDSFHLETRLTNSLFWPAIRCFSAYVQVACEKGDILFKFVNEGCSQFGEFAISEKNEATQSVDLTGFSVKISEWNTIQIENQDKHVTVKVNDHLIFQDSYTNPVGKIIGSTILFHGIGSVDYFHLNDSDNQPVYCENFD